jgi:hypothetical protein
MSLGNQQHPYTGYTGMSRPSARMYMDDGEVSTQSEGHEPFGIYELYPAITQRSEWGSTCSNYNSRESFCTLSKSSRRLTLQLRTKSLTRLGLMASRRRSNSERTSNPTRHTATSRYPVNPRQAARHSGSQTTPMRASLFLPTPSGQGPGSTTNLCKVQARYLR